MRRLYSILFLVFASYFAISQTPLNTALDFLSNDIHGEPIHLFAQLDSGKYVVLDFFFVTCTPCQAIVPFVNQSYKDFGCNEGDVFYVSISGREGDTDAECELYDQTYGVDYRTISGFEGNGYKIAERYQIPAYPTVIIIAPDRSIIEQGIFPVSSADDVNIPLLNAGCSYRPCASFVIENYDEIINVFPNPTNGVCNLSMKESGSYKVSVFDMHGAERFQKESHFHKGEKIQLDLNHLLPGWYLIRVQGENHNSIIKIGKL